MSSVSSNNSVTSEDETQSLSGGDTAALLMNEDYTCSLCNDKFKNPRILTCLHVFCTVCLEKLMSGDDDDDDDEELEASEDEDVKVKNPDVLVCPTCEQETRLGEKGIDGLPFDFVLANLLDMSDIEERQIICTSCKAKEKAVARCSDCATFLCPNCVTAHQYMRCFENHKVLTFEELKSAENGLSLHRPVFCPLHPTENMKYFCNSCQVTVCNNCTITDHKSPEHLCERFQDIEQHTKEEMTSLMNESRSKVQFCEDTKYNLQNCLSELQEQRDHAKGLIQETFQSYKAILEKCQENALKDLGELHYNQELKIMDMIHSVSKTVDRIEDGCKFTDRIVTNGNDVELLMMKKVVKTQLMSLINNTPTADVSNQIEFVSDTKEFEDAVTRAFGHFKKKETSIETQVSSLQSSFDTDAFSLPSGVLSPVNATLLSLNTIPQTSVTGGAAAAVQTPTDFMPVQNPVSHLPPLSLSVSIPNTITPPPLISSMSNITGSMGSGIAAITERSLSRSSHSPAMSDSGISLDASSGGSGSNTPLVNLATLARLGTVNINPQGQITLNGQVLPGLNLNNVTGIQSILGRQNSMASNHENDLLAELGALPPLDGISSSNTTSPTPTLDELATLLNRTQLNGGFGSLTQPPSSTQNNTLTNIGTFNASTTRMGSTPSPVPSGIYGSTSNPFNPANPTPPFPRRSGKMSAMQIRCKFGQLGPGKGQFNSPHGFCLGLEEDIIVADTNNHRIQVFEKTGEFKYQFGIPGREEGQLWYPRKVAVMRNSGKYVVCDRGNERSRMQIFTKNGHFIKKIAIRYIDIVAGLAITPQGHIVAVDSVSPTVFCIAETGELVRWFDCSDYMREPSDIAVNGKEYFVCDFKGHCVVVFNEEGQFLRRIGCENITNFPNGIDISDAGDVLIGDSHGNRFHVGVFQRDGSLIGEFECPYVKVSRCCGLKITSEGYIVTLAKNNHHVLVLNTLYIA
ncbi:protein meiotic P26-like [Tubulanus polymorphus]|uniref:protein meiotic P26-like n=1 Tax=Tubulanus polymorphus TaxID=672921 RepID=UPI003DA3799D